MLLFGTLDAASYEAPRFLDRELRRLEALVQVKIDRELTDANLRGARVAVVSRLGHCDEQVDADDPGLLLDAAGAIAKFAEAAAPTVAPAASQAFCAALLQARADVPMRRLWQLLCAGAANFKET